MVTTQKDVVNLGEGHTGLLAPLPLYWLKVRMTIEHESAFLEQLLAMIGDRPPVDGGFQQERSPSTQQ